MFKPINGYLVLKLSDPQPGEGPSDVFNVLATSENSECGLRVKDQITYSESAEQAPFEFEGDEAVLIHEQYVTGIILSPG